MNPELDKLVSAAIDGEATPAELAKFVDDPGFAAAKAELEAASQFVVHAEAPFAPAGLAETQISAAMDLFRAESAQRTLKAAEPARVQQAVAPERKRSWSMPGWLAPALFSVAVIGGVGFAAANLTTNADESTSFSDASLEVATTTADSGRSTETTEAMEEAPTAEMDDSGSAAADTELSFEPPAPIDLTGSFFVASRNLKASDVAKLATPTPTIAPESYDRCSEINGFLVPPGDLTLVIPFLYDQEPAELLVYAVGVDLSVTIIVNDACEVLDQS